MYIFMLCILCVLCILLRVDGEETDEMDIGRGVRQGSVGTLTNTFQYLLGSNYR